MEQASQASKQASKQANLTQHSLALAEMKTLLRDVYSRFSTTPDPSMTEESMAMSDQLISTRPLGKRCLLQFHPLVDGATVDSKK